jgi:signal transduction histidine kinase
MSMVPQETTDSVEEQLAQTSARLKQRERQLNAIHRVNEALFLRTSVDELVRVALSEAVAVADADVGSFQLYNAHDDTLVFQHVLDPENAHLIGFSTSASQGISGQVFRSGTARLISDVNREATFNQAVDAKTGYQSHSMLTVPVKRMGGQPIGVMQVLNANRPFDQDDVEVLEVLCVYAANAIETTRLAEEARKAQIINVLGDISHDIKNMLTPIQSGIWMLQPWMDTHFETLQQLTTSAPAPSNWQQVIEDCTVDLRENYKWILENALDAAERVQNRTKELADVVKGEMAQPVFAPTNVNITAERVITLLSPVALSAEVTLTPELDPNLSLAEIDEKQLYNALYNLVNNAIPETPAGGQIWLRTSAPTSDESGASLAEPRFTIQVQDTGRGIAPDVLARLFTDDAISTKPGGTGLGTRIVAGVVRRHNGTIAVDSVEGSGTTFTITLPLNQ